MNNIKFIIYCPWTDKYSGGIVVLHKLADSLYKEEVDVYMQVECMFNKNVKIINNNTTFLINNTIVIYPEVVYGNPFGSKYTVRWLLYDLKEDVSKTYTTEDYLFKYSKNFIHTSLAKEIDVLRVESFEYDKFFDKRLIRSGYCHSFHKNTSIDKSIFNKSVSIDNYKAMQDGFKYLNDIFNEKEYFISYDDATALNYFAAMSGCISVIMPSNKYKNTEELVKDENFKYGISCGFDGIEHAKNTMNLVKDFLQQKEEYNTNTVRNFIKFWKNELFN